MKARTITRKKNEGEPGSFDELRREGMAFVQGLSGDHWTDFNLHDPGVTILEHLSFALTDLIYRTKFPVQDFLTPESGETDWRALGLHAPQDILTCRPTTATDIRRAILDRVESIDNVWLETAGCGLYTVAVRLVGGLTPEQGAAAVEEVRQAFHITRNLCEDIDDIVVLQELDYELAATIDVSSEAEPADILAKIYYECSRHIATSVSPLTYQEMLGGNARFDEIFDGPLTSHGVIPHSDLSASPNDDRTDLYSIIRNVEGVEQIRSVDLRPVGGNWPKLSKGQAQPLPRLRIPRRVEDNRISLLRSNAVLPVSLPAVLTAYNKLAFREKSLRHTPHDPASFVELPKGQYRDLRQYASIQNDFPLVYGIGAFGLPDSALQQDHARAFQLKAYLLLFEQVMANFLADLQNVRQLFSVHGARRSYASQTLDNATIPNIEPVYARDVKESAVAGVLVEEYDRHRYADRRNRLLDYQLAMYGDGLSQFSLRQFDSYHRQDEIEDSVLRNKTALLENIVAANRDRAAGFNIAGLSWNTENVSGLAAKVGLVLGLRFSHERSLADVFVEKGLSLVSDAEFGETPDEGAVALEFVDLDDIRPRVSDPFFEVSPGVTAESRQRLLENVVFLRKNLVSDSILRFGVQKARYAVGAVGDGEHYQVALNVSDDPDSDGRWLYLSTYGERNTALEAASALRRFLIDLNRDSEGIHVVEHILLRPPGFSATAPPPQDEAFYPFRISVVFPAWPARFRNEEFRKLAEETVLLNCPAHIYPEFLWLEFEQMREFELLHRDLLKLWSAPDGSRDGWRSAAAGVDRFLRSKRRP